MLSIINKVKEGEHELVNCFDIFSLEWRATYDESVQNNTNGPGVHLKAVAVDGVEQYFRSNIVRRSANCLLSLSGILDQRCETKVSYFYVHASVKEQVSKFQVTVDNLMGVHVVACADQLNHEDASFHLREATAPAQHVHERTGGAKFQRHVYIIVVFEAVVKGDNVGMRK